MFTSLVKAAQHKYIKRVPKPGGGYTYYYRETSLATSKLREMMIEGAAFKLTHKGQIGHFHIKAADEDYLYIEHDERPGVRVRMTRGELAGIIHNQYTEKLRAAAMEAHRTARKLDEQGNRALARTHRKRAAKLDTAAGPEIAERAADALATYRINEYTIDTDTRYMNGRPKAQGSEAANAIMYDKMKAIPRPKKRTLKEVAARYNATMEKAARELTAAGIWDSPNIDENTRAAEFLASLTIPSHMEGIPIDEEITDERRARYYIDETRKRTEHLLKERVNRYNIAHNNTPQHRAGCTTHKPAGASAYDVNIEVNLSEVSSVTLIHEAVHPIEYANPYIAGAITCALCSRTDPQDILVAGGRRKEYAFDDEFMSKYTGRVYPKAVEPSEFLTMGLQAILHTARDAYTLAHADPHHFIACYAILKGYFNE